MRLVYLGTPAMAVAPLQALVAAGHDVALVVTGADKRRGRGSATSPNPVKQAAVDLGIPVTHDIDDLVAFTAVQADGGNPVELGVVVAYGRIIKPHILAVMPMINLHFSLLPRWRGAAPVERALLAGDTTTGVCVMDVEEGLDTGGVHARVEVKIGECATAEELRRDLVDVGSALLVETLDRWPTTSVPQAGEPTYAHKFTPDERRIDWANEPTAIDRLIRVGGAWTTYRGARFKIHAADLVTGADGVLRVVPTVVQPEGKPIMDAAAWRNGAQPGAGDWSDWFE